MLSLTLPMFAGILLLVIVYEVDRRWSLLTYLAVSLLSLFVTYDKSASLIFILFFGHYPLLHGIIESTAKSLKIPLKLLVFNGCMVMYYHLTVYLLGIDDLLEATGEFGKYGAILLLVVCNPFFLVYDFSLDGLLVVYLQKLKPRIMGGRR